MSETNEGLRDKFFKWKKAFDSKDMKVNRRKTKVMVRGGITKDGMSKNKVDPCGVSSLRDKANSVLRVHCGRWIHGRCTKVKRVTPKFSWNLTCRKCQGNIGEAEEQEEKLCDGVEMVTGNSHIMGKMNAQTQDVRLPEEDVGG